MRNTLTTYDLSPLFRSSVGFDSLSRLFDTALKHDESAPSYPPYNIEKQGEDSYRITMAVAGFAPTDLTITSQQNTLVINGRQKEESKEDGKSFLHRGIAARAFERRFQLADHVRVTGANMEHGLLHVTLLREVPEAAKPRIIDITSAAGGSKTIDGTAH